MRYYAFVHQYGQQACDQRGHDLGTCVSFPTKAARDAWVADGPDYSTAAGYREAITAHRAASFVVETISDYDPYAGLEAYL